MELFAVGIRNILRNRRRSILNIIALTVAISLMILGLGWVGGYGTYLYGALIDFETGHIQVLREKYLDESGRMPVDITVSGYTDLRSGLDRLDGVSEAAGRINFFMTLSNGRSSLRLLGRGIDPPHEAGVTVIDEYIKEGKYLSPDEGGILLGKSLAEKLNVKVGDTLFVTAMDRYSVQNFIDVKLAGIYNFGYPAVDDHVVFMDLSTAQSLLSLDDEVTRVVLRLDDGVSVQSALPRVESFLADRTAGNGANAGSTDGKLVAESWKRFAQTAVAAVQSDSGAFWLMLIILYLLITLGILNSMSMSINERTGEIGTLRAMGMKRREVIYMLMAEAFGLAVVAAVVALIFSLPIAWWLQYIGIDISSALPEDIPIPFGKTFRADFRFWHYIFSIGIAIVSAVLGSIVPSRRAAKTNIARAMAGRRER